MEIVVGKENKSDLDDFLNAVETTAPEATLSLTEEGIQVRTMDPSHVFMIDATLKDTAFWSYDHEEDEQICLSITELNRFIQRMGNESITLKRIPEKARMQITSAVGGHRRQFEIPMLEPLDEEAPVPDISFKAKIQVMTDAIKEAVRDANLVSEHIEMKTHMNQFSFNSHGDLGSTHSAWDNESDDILSIEASEEITATFTLSMMKDLIDAVRFAETVTLEGDTDMPMKIHAEGGKNNCLEMTFHLAPCIGA